MLMARRRTGRQKKSDTQRGFTLLEVMIALLIFAVGLLQVAALQAVAKRANYESIQRTTASHMAFDMLERMRANSAAVDTYSSAAGERILGGGSRGAEPAPDCNSPADGCSSADLAIHDLWEWEQRLDGATEVNAGVSTGGLISPTACIRGPLGGGTGIYTAAIAWRGVSELTNPAADACGDASGQYGGNNEFRRVLLVQTFIGSF
jgi:type IV pilus assembly protein PilV